MQYVMNFNTYIQASEAERQGDYANAEEKYHTTVTLNVVGISFGLLIFVLIILSFTLPLAK